MSLPLLPRFEDPCSFVSEEKVCGENKIARLQSLSIKRLLWGIFGFPIPRFLRRLPLIISEAIRIMRNRFTRSSSITESTRQSKHGLVGRLRQSRRLARKRSSSSTLRRNVGIAPTTNKPRKAKSFIFAGGRKS